MFTKPFVIAATTVLVLILSSTPSLGFSVENDGSSRSSSRRGFIGKAVGGVMAAGIVGNGIAVQGPSPIDVVAGSMVGKTVVITGGNTGLGLESAKRLASAGATIVITSRNLQKGQKAVQLIQTYTNNNNNNNNNVYVVPLDLCDLSSVKSFPSALERVLGGNDDNNNNNNKKVDVLINNAGVMAVPDLQLTKDGYEKTFQTNHLGHFALTALMMPMMNPNGSRVINVASAAHMIVASNGGLDFTNLNGEREYEPWQAYGFSKLENILFTQELQRRCDAAGNKVTTAVLHPGAVRTDLPRYMMGEDNFVSMVDDTSPSPLAEKPSILTTLGLYIGYYFSKNVQRGANSQIWLASTNPKDEDIAGKYFQNMKEVKLSAFAQDKEQARQLWEMSEKLTGIQFNL